MKADLKFAHAWGEPENIVTSTTFGELNVLTLETKTQKFRLTEMQDGSLRVEAWTPIKLRPEAANLIVVEYALDNV